MAQPTPHTRGVRRRTATMADVANSPASPPRRLPRRQRERIRRPPHARARARRHARAQLPAQLRGACAGHRQLEHAGVVSIDTPLSARPRSCSASSARPATMATSSPSQARSRSIRRRSSTRIDDSSGTASRGSPSTPARQARRPTRPRVDIRAARGGRGRALLGRIPVAAVDQFAGAVAADPPAARARPSDRSRTSPARWIRSGRRRLDGWRSMLRDAGGSRLARSMATGAPGRLRARPAARRRPRGHRDLRRQRSDGARRPARAAPRRA